LVPCNPIRGLSRGELVGVLLVRAKRLTNWWWQP
jgi:hypothetical protein